MTVQNYDFKVNLSLKVCPIAETFIHVKSIAHMRIQSINMHLTFAMHPFRLNFMFDVHTSVYVLKALIPLNIKMSILSAATRFSHLTS